jgi:alkanesulfonate monooxygenase SsuD/methylene tetrahydromethanopterin reductase-like flavin-dependent oxidoreductase (luciferase family)
LPSIRAEHHTDRGHAAEEVTVSERAPIGVFIPTATPPEQIPQLAATAEALGYSEVWVAEDYFAQGGFTAACLVLTATSSVRVGLGVVAAVARHPAVTAMEIASLARTYPGRFQPGIGHGLPAWTDQMGITAQSPLSALRECVSTIRSLLNGECVDLDGKQFTARAVQLAHPVAEQVPLLTGVLGPKSLQLSGEVADGTVISILAGPKYIEAASEQIKAGMDKAGRTGEHLLPTFGLLSIGKDGKAAKDAMRPILGLFLSAIGPHNSLTAAYGYNDQLAELIDAGGPEVVAREMPQEWVESLTLSGEPDEVAGQMEQLLIAGATSVMVSPVNGATAADELRLVSDAVLPRLRRR